VRVASLIPLYGISWPLIKTLELCGIWPKLMSRRPMAPPAPFGDYRPAAHDVIVSSYFKAGTTWTLQIATQIAFRGQAELLTLDQQRRIDEHCRDHLQRLGCEFPRRYVR
jgi:hypothetical protein